LDCASVSRLEVDPITWPNVVYRAAFSSGAERGDGCRPRLLGPDPARSGCGHVAAATAKRCIGLKRTARRRCAGRWAARRQCRQCQPSNQPGATTWRRCVRRAAAHWDLWARVLGDLAQITAEYRTSLSRSCRTQQLLTIYVIHHGAGHKKLLPHHTDHPRDHLNGHDDLRATGTDTTAAPWIAPHYVCTSRYWSSR
jgi:hypothetical protein